MCLPKENEIWRHRKTMRVYRIVCMANESATKENYPLTTVYRDVETGRIYSAPYSSFKERLFRTGEERIQ